MAKAKQEEKEEPETLDHVEEPHNSVQKEDNAPHGRRVAGLN